MGGRRERQLRKRNFAAKGPPFKVRAQGPPPSPSRPRDKIDIKYKLVHEYSSRVPNSPGFLDGEPVTVGARAAFDL